MTGQACFNDLKKAFDTLNHEILLNKLENYGFRGKINEILGSFLRDRKQYVRLNEIETDKLTVQTGVPQGSVLGPFLFLIYINDLPDSCEKAEVAMFADDTTLKSNQEKELIHFLAKKLIAYGIGSHQIN